jgi:hypothetical protein
VSIAATRADALVEVGRDALAQIARLADVERHTQRVDHPIDPGQVRQAVDDGSRIERWQWIRHGQVGKAAYNRELFPS